MRYLRGQAHILTKIGEICKNAVIPRTARVSTGGMLFHVLNRDVGRMQIFRSEKGYEAFHRVGKIKGADIGRDRQVFSDELL
jgi:hypothetical protein